MTNHFIEPNEETLHSFFSAELPPILTIQSGDTVGFGTLDAGWNLERPQPDGTFPAKATSKYEGPSGHALTGPIYIEAAEPGMTLAVRTDAIELGAWGWTAISGLYAEGKQNLHVWSLDQEGMSGRNQFGHEVGLRPFMGVMGMPPPEAGKHPSGPPRIWGGNLDCKELVEGSTLYLPIPVKGALFSVGDGHAVQGDGEISRTAIECPMRRVDLNFEVISEMPLTTPRAYTPAGWLTFGLNEDLNLATQTAVHAMLDLMMEKFDLSREDALVLGSLVVDLRITQVANGVHGVHAVLPHGCLKL